MNFYTKAIINGETVKTEFDGDVYTPCLLCGAEFGPAIVFSSFLILFCS